MRSDPLLFEQIKKIRWEIVAQENIFEQHEQLVNRRDQEIKKYQEQGELGWVKDRTRAKEKEIAALLPEKEKLNGVKNELKNICGGSDYRLYQEVMTLGRQYDEYVHEMTDWSDEINELLKNNLNNQQIKNHVVLTNQLEKVQKLFDDNWQDYEFLHYRALSSRGGGGTQISSLMDTVGEIIRVGGAEIWPQVKANRIVEKIADWKYKKLNHQQKAGGLFFLWVDNLNCIEREHLHSCISAESHHQLFRADDDSD